MSGRGYDDDGLPIATTEPQVDDAEQTTGIAAEQILSLLMAGSPGPAAVGERAELLAYLLPGCAYRAATLRELGARIGCSHVAAAARLNKLRAAFAKELADFRP